MEALFFQVLDFVCSFGHISEHGVDAAFVEKAWSLALFILTKGAGWLVAFEAEALCAFVDPLHCSSAAEERVFVVSRLLHFLAMLAVFLEADSVN